MLLRVLLFPFRALWFLLKLVLVPWYLRWLFRLPWWVLGGFATLVAVLAVQDGARVAEGRVELVEALAQAPPEVVPLAQFDPLRHASEHGEVRLLGTFRKDVTVEAWETTGPDMAYLPLFVGDTTEVGAVLLSLKLKRGMLANWIEEARADGRIIVPGAIRSSAHQDAIVAALRIDGFRVADNVPIISPFLEGREQGLERAVGGSPALVGLLAAVAAILGLVAAYRFVRARNGKAAAPIVPDPAPPPARIPRPAAPVRPTTAVNGPWGQAKEGPVKRLSPAARPVEAVEPEGPLPPPTPKSLPRPFVPRSPKALVDEAFGRKPGGGPKDP